MVRNSLVLAGFAALALALVWVRTEQARSAARTVAIESHWINARRSLWSLQARAARLKAPQQVHDRAVFLQAGVVPSDEQEPSEGGEQLVRSNHEERAGERSVTP